MSSPLAREDGFTFVELLVAMTVSLVLLFAALLALDTLNRGAASTNRLTGAQDAARRDANRILAVLRDAGAPPPLSGASPATVIQALANDLVFRTSSWPGESGVAPAGTHIGRLCLDTATRTLWFDGLRAGTAGGNPSPGSACPSTATGWTHLAMARNVVNSAAQPVFGYGPASPVRAVGVSLRTEGGTVAKTRPLALASGGTLRGALAPQVSASDITVGPCTQVTGTARKALLTLNPAAGGSSAAGAKLQAANAISVGPGQILVNATSATTVQVSITVTNALGLQTPLAPKSVSCP